ncbi:MAG: rsmB 1 [Verrucomicrobiales bacterium]|nr:rsmB 1 [Verrucomicrobiales bacterium]
MLERPLEKIISAVIQRADAAHPADLVLRAELKAQRGLSREESSSISKAVFTYFRWFGWLDKEAPVEEGIQQAMALAEKFVERPDRFPEEVLRTKAIPPWISQYMDVSVDWLRRIQIEPKIWLRSRVGKGEQLERKLFRVERTRGELADALIYSGQEDLFRTAEFQAGEFELQDVSSQIVGLLCAPKPGETWWDACAGEGGKTLHFSDLMQNKGAIWATDRAEWRLQKLKQRGARAQMFNYRTAHWTGVEKLPMKTKCDGVLVDAPCSGVGTWQRNPHARWTATPTDVLELAAIQTKLLSHAAKAVKPGGKIFYSVCTLTRNETTEVAAQFEKAFPEFEPIALRNPSNVKREPAPQLWLWPQECNGNGMFIAGWQRKKV